MPCGDNWTVSTKTGGEIVIQTQIFDMMWILDRQQGMYPHHCVLVSGMHCAHTTYYMNEYYTATMLWFVHIQYTTVHVLFKNLCWAECGEKEARRQCAGYRA
jgi:hypothetical protein